MEREEIRKQILEALMEQYHQRVLKVKERILANCLDAVRKEMAEKRI